MRTQVSTPHAVQLAALAVAVACTAAVGCTTTGSRDNVNPVAQRTDIDAGIDVTLSRLYESAPESRQLVARAAGVLVFPSVLSVSFGVGAEHGDGALRVDGKTVGYYKTTAGSFGFQAEPSRKRSWCSS
jgi:lipid-binding SYLF domain-containing protein